MVLNFITKRVSVFKFIFFENIFNTQKFYLVLCSKKKAQINGLLKFNHL